MVGMSRVNSSIGLAARIAATLGVCAFAASVSAQQGPGVQSSSAPPPPASSGAPAPNANRLTPSELENLLGPIALFPDNLLANMLAAAVYPSEVQAAGKFMAAGGTVAQVEQQQWEQPVRAVAAVPEALKMMVDYPDWTVALGQAYLNQAKDVMDVVQSLRKKAWDTGALRSTPEQVVKTEEQVIYIQPANPAVVYVPTYNPSVVYVSQPSNTVAAGLIGFGVGVAVGAILSDMDCYWHSGCVGWGWHGNNDINYKHNTTINGDVNIGSGNNNNVGSGNRGNVSDRMERSPRVGQEGNAFAPNRNKSLATQQPDRTSNWKGAGSANSARPGAQPGARPSTQPANRPSGSAASGARPSTQPANRPSSPAASGSRPSAQPASPAARPSAPAVPPRPSNGSSGFGSQQPRNASAYSGGQNTRADSSRGKASRQSASRPSGGGRPSGGRGGGGRR